MPIPFFGLSAGVTESAAREAGIPFWVNSPATRKGEYTKYSPRIDEPLPLLVWSMRFSEPNNWFPDLETHDVRFAAGPVVRVPEDWDRMELLYKHTAARITNRPIVPVGTYDVVRRIPKSYDIAVFGNDDLDPWSYRGRQVWIVGCSTPQQYWEKYSMLRLVGVDVVGLVHGPLWQVSSQPSVVGGHLQFVPALDITLHERVRQSLRTICDFWEAMTLLYG